MCLVNIWVVSLTLHTISKIGVARELKIFKQIFMNKMLKISSLYHEYHPLSIHCDKTIMDLKRGRNAKKQRHNTLQSILLSLCRSRSCWLSALLVFSFFFFFFFFPSFHPFNGFKPKWDMNAYVVANEFYLTLKIRALKPMGFHVKFEMLLS